MRKYKMADLIINTNDTFKCNNINPVINNMFEIVSNNMSKILNTKINTSDYNIWKKNILNNKNIKTIIRNTDRLNGYLQYIEDTNEAFICEIQIAENNQHVHRTLNKLLLEFLNQINIQDNDNIYSNINIKNEHSINVFTHIGFVKINNKYQISKKDLSNYILKNKR
ncbi:MAG TPA: hypothetical protein PKG93_00095 [Bacilli bacterium]|nr:hypothetical protein [Bacilli bacterium]